MIAMTDSISIVRSLGTIPWRSGGPTPRTRIAGREISSFSREYLAHKVRAPCYQARSHASVFLYKATKRPSPRRSLMYPVDRTLLLDEKPYPTLFILGFFRIRLADNNCGDPTASDLDSVLTPSAFSTFLFFFTPVSRLTCEVSVCVV